MSIELSARLYPSRILRSMMAVFALLIAMSVWLAANDLGSAFLRAGLALSAGLLAALFCIIWYRQHATEQLLIISAAGALTIIPDWKQAPEAVHTVTLAGHSMVWPKLIALRLLDERGKRRYLLILPDTTDEQSFRSLRVAILWMQGRMQAQ